MAVSDIERIRDNEFDFNSPDIEALWNQLVEHVEQLENITRAFRIVEGLADSDPPNTAPSTITDVGPTFGAITDAKIGHTLEIKTSTLAENKRFQITDINNPVNTIEVAENLFSEGVRSGDEYRVIFAPPALDNVGHSHDGIDSQLLPTFDLSISILFGDC